MLWPPPQRGDSVTLTCGCLATVRMALPMLFLYVIRLQVSNPTCHRSHSIGSLRLAHLESLIIRHND
jgi:hypothetical protein